MVIRLLAFLAILLSSIPRLAGQGAGAPNRPRVGLVLGGGGARGLAHIGVLEWLEEHRIPIDYIAGTSMGGIIGGLYAMGMRPPQLRELTGTIDWEQALGGGAPYEQLLLRRKQDNRDFPGVQLGWNNGLRLRAGLNGGHFVSLILDRAALPYWQVRDFDELPIPFRCVAADLLTAKTVVLSDGPIGDALRATMGIPGIFTPVERGGALLVDGGLLNNLPTDVAKSMGADVIIAVNVGTALRTRQGLQSLIGILDQATSLAMTVSVRKNLGLADVVITPDLGKYTAASFQATEPLARAGYAAAERMQSELRRLQLGVPEWERYRDNLAARVRRETPVLQSVVIQEPAADAANAIQEQLMSHRGAPLNVDALEQDLTKILGWGRYASVNYDLRPSSAPLRSPELVVRPEPLVHGAAIIRLGLAVQGAHNQQVEVNLRARNTFFDIGGYGSEMRVDASIGTTLLYGMEFYRPIGKSKFFIAPRAVAVRTTANVSPSKDTLANYRRSSAGAGVDLGYGVLSQSDEVRVGYEMRYDDASVVIGNPSLPSFSGTTNVLSLQWLHDRQDSATVPRRGLRSTLRGSWFLNSATSNRDFPQAELTGSYFQPVSERGSVLLTAASGTTFNRTAPLGQEFALGGPLRLSSYGLYELAGSSYALAGGGYLHAIGGNGLAKFYAVGVVQAARVFRPISTDRSGLDVTAAVIADTFIGPITLGFAMGDGGHRKGFVSIGRIF